MDIHANIKTFRQILHNSALTLALKSGVSAGHQKIGACLASSSQLLPVGAPDWIQQDHCAQPLV